MDGHCPYCKGKIFTSGRCYTPGCNNQALAIKIQEIPNTDEKPSVDIWPPPPQGDPEKPNLRKEVEELKRKVRELEGELSMLRQGFSPQSTTHEVIPG